MRIIYHHQSDEHPCSYQDLKLAREESFIVKDLTGEEYETLMNRGFRKFGRVVFHPTCLFCQDCRPIRIDIGKFKKNRSQERNLTHNQDLLIKIGEPIIDPIRMRLFDNYHLYQHEKKGWPLRTAEPDDYQLSFLENQIPHLEISVWKEEELMAICLLDLTPNTASLIYHYYDPDEVKRGLGNYIILKCIEAAQQLRKKWVYLGYYVAGSPSMSYKNKYQPAEILSTEGEWQAMVVSPKNSKESH